MSLREYARKRDFRVTAEPSGKETKKSRTSAPRFVIQKHDASRLHYDFRLEIDGTLKSWAVPKGVPYAKGDKRLAVHVEDHPLDYASFEGIIPAGQYGGGTVMLWDEGTYESLGGDLAKDHAAGKLHFALRGKKLKGEWILVHIKRGEGNEWLLIKSGEDLKPVTKKEDDKSCVSGRTMHQIAQARDAEWQSKRTASKKPVTPPKLAFIEPMKATLVSAPPSEGHWLYELKFDGFRAVALKSGSNVQLLSRNEKDFTTRFGDIAQAIAQWPVKEAVLDGEIVALDAEGRSSFQLLQGSEAGVQPPPLAFYVFDLLRHDGADLTGEPLVTRRARLQSLMESAAEPIRYSATIDGDPEVLLEEVRRRGLEGLIGKERDSLYEVGRRSKSWIKLKCAFEQELVIGGYTPPAGTRKHFGALLVGYFEKRKLCFAGKVGAGFDAASLRSLFAQMKPIETESSPFANLPEKKQGRWSQNITPRMMQECHWVEPRLVCQVRYTEWTTDGKLRHPVFLGLRKDKAAKDVVREIPT
jgi:bifunctional non-homologous end joining protein LigD